MWYDGLKQLMSFSVWIFCLALLNDFDQKMQELKYKFAKIFVFCQLSTLYNKKKEKERIMRETACAAVLETFLFFLSFVVQYLDQYHLIHKNVLCCHQLTFSSSTC